ncbi:MAG: aminotransferase class III-fold pyridoxal phosphate-dependent enzyme [Pseudomonadota bacterium]
MTQDSAIDALLLELAARQISLTAENGDLHFRAPKGAMDSALRTRLRRLKPHLIDRLAPKTAPARASKQFSIGGTRPDHAPLVSPDWQPDDPFLRHVEPYKGYLLDRLGIAKTFPRAMGSHLWTEDGQQVLDCLSQYGSLPFGHNPARIWEALSDCRKMEEPAFTANAVSDAAGALAAKLVGLWPEAGFVGVTFTNSGAESVETALKLARAATGRAATLSTKRGFHGLTLGALSVGGSPVYRDAFQVPDTSQDCIPYGDITALEQAFERAPERYAALILEPIQGEGGIIDPPPGYLACARALCDAYGTLLILDEVQTGLGRTGAIFAAQAENVVADVVTLAKALGGGLMPIGAVLYRENVRTVAFGVRHSSTFAGGALACRAGLATLEMLTENEGALLDHVRTTGARLRVRLDEIAARHPDLVEGITGRGLMQGIRLRFDTLWQRPGLFGLLHAQKLMIHIAVSHLLNSGGIRLAPSFSSGNVLRIQPPLTITEDELEPLYTALEDTLSAIEAGRTSHLLRHYIGTDIDLPDPARGARTDRSPPRPHPAPEHTTDNGRFAFVIHPLEASDFLRLDPDLADVPADRMARMVAPLADYIDPVPVEALEITSATGAKAYGELIMVPYTPEDLMQMSVAKAAEEIGLAVRVAEERGAKVVGLGGFSSIVTQGGGSLVRPDGPALTSGNAFTSIAAAHAIRDAFRTDGRSCDTASVAVVGAAGMVGRAVSVLAAELAGRVILMGNPNRAQGLRRRGLELAAELVTKLRELAALRPPPPGSLAARVAKSDRPADALIAGLEAEGALVIADDLAGALAEADAVVLATNSTDRFVRAAHLKTGATVCDVSRPFNIHPDVAQTRSDVRLIEGGLVRPLSPLPHASLAGPAQDLIFACAAETMLWALDQSYDMVHPMACMEIPAMARLEEMGQRHGFRVEASKSFDAAGGF